MRQFRQVKKPEPEAMPEADVNTLATQLSKLLTGKADKKALEQIKATAQKLGESLAMLSSQLQVIGSFVDELKAGRVSTDGELTEVKVRLEALATSTAAYDSIGELKQRLGAIEGNKEGLNKQTEASIAFLISESTVLKQTIEELQATTKELAKRRTRTIVSSGDFQRVKLDDLAAPDDNTDLNASTAKHGLLLKLGGGTSNFLRADGTWAAPAGGGDMTKAVYDADDDGKVTAAVDADTVGGEAPAAFEDAGTAAAAVTSHEGEADPHTGYRLESADHTHQSTGAQAGKLDHGLALDGLTDDDHTQYIKHALATAANDFLVASGSGAYVKKTLAETLTLLLSSALAENDAIILDAALSADGKYSGIVETGLAGATLAFGDVIYQAVGDNRWELAKADATATCVGKIGICVLAAASDGDPTVILLYGKVRADTAFPTFTAFAPVYISAATGGDLTSTAPATSTNVVRIVGYANSGDELFFSPDGSWVELA